MKDAKLTKLLLAKQFVKAGSTDLTSSSVRGSELGPVNLLITLYLQQQNVHPRAMATKVH